ncbi:MAG: GNAT family N-acetyltransferase [Coriobacteriia bacterium]
MLIRRISESDIEPVVELVLRNYDGVMCEHHSPEVLARFRDDVTVQSFRKQMRRKQVFIVEDAGEVVATGSLANFGTAEEPKYTVSQFYVRPDLHGCGIGRRLLAHLIEVANGLDAASIHVPSSRNAIGFYERAGFVIDVASRTRLSRSHE